MEVFLQNSNRQLNYQNYLVLLPFTSGANEEVRPMHSASIKLAGHTDPGKNSINGSG